MTNPRSSPTLRSNRVQILREEEEKRQKLKAADLAECTKPLDQYQGQLAVCKDDLVAKSLVKLDYIHIKNNKF